MDITLWTGASVDLADDLLLWSGQALFLEHQRVHSGSQRPPSVSWTLDHWGPSPLQPLCALGAGHPTCFFMSQMALACYLFLPFLFLVVTVFSGFPDPHLHRWSVADGQKQMARCGLADPDSTLALACVCLQGA